MKKTAAIVLCISLLFFFIFVSEKNKDTFSKEEYKVFSSFCETCGEIPLIEQGYVPQGICKLTGTDYVIISLYNDERPSVMAAVSESSGKCRAVIRMRLPSGKLCSDHACGVASDGYNIWYAHNKGVFRIPVSEFYSAFDSGEVELNDYTKLGIYPAYLSYNSGYLLAGEFVRTRSGVKGHKYKQNNAFLEYFYLNIDSSTDYGSVFKKDSQGVAVPQKVISVPDQVQGAAISDKGEIVLTTSYGRRSKSHIYIFDSVTDAQEDAQVFFGDDAVRLYYLGEDRMIVDIISPPMIENVCWSDGRLYTMFESTAKKYALGVIDTTDKVYVFDMREYLKFKRIEK